MGPRRIKTFNTDPHLPCLSSCLQLVPDLGTCVTTCRSSEFSSSNATCLSCHKSCGECYGPGSNHCLTCLPNHSLASGSCLSTCPPGQHKLAGSASCIDCH